MKESKRYKRYIRNKRLLTLGLHDAICQISIRYRINTIAGGYAVAVSHGENLNNAVIQLTKQFPALTHQQAAKSIIFHSKFGR